MQIPTSQQLEDMISELKEQLEFCNDKTIADELKKEIKYRENQLRELTIKNETI